MIPCILEYLLHSCWRLAAVFVQVIRNLPWRFWYRKFRRCAVASDMTTRILSHVQRTFCSVGRDLSVCMVDWQRIDGKPDDPSRHASVSLSSRTSRQCNITVVVGDPVGWVL